MPKPQRSTVEIQINPYGDGSGHAHTVIAKRDGETIKLEIKQHDHFILMSDDEWFAVRDSLDTAIKMAGGPDVGAGELEGSAVVSIRNEE